MKEQAHKQIGVLHFKKRGNFTTGKGTAFLISSNLVLTTAHNLVDSSTGSIFHGIVFYPGHQGTIKRENAYEIEDFFFPGRYAIKPNPPIESDFALLKLKKHVQG